MILNRIFSINTLKLSTPLIKRLLTTQSQLIPKIQCVPPLNSWIYQQNDKIINPTPITSNTRIELPNGLVWIPPLTEPPSCGTNEIIAPTTESAETPKEAIRMLVVRRKKMKKHKLKKLRKRMKFEYAKRRQKREMKKEKEFRAVLIQQCKEAEAFLAEEYVAGKLQKLHEIVIPRYWKGKKMPEFLVREKMGLPPKS